MKRDKIVNNLTERLCSNPKSAVPIVDVSCLQAKLLPGRYNLYGNSLEIQVKYMIEKKLRFLLTWNNKHLKYVVLLTVVSQRVGVKWRLKRCFQFLRICRFSFIVIYSTLYLIKPFLQENISRVFRHNTHH